MHRGYKTDTRSDRGVATRSPVAIPLDDDFTEPSGRSVGPTRTVGGSSHDSAPSAPPGRELRTATSAAALLRCGCLIVARRLSNPLLTRNHAVTGAYAQRHHALPEPPHTNHARRRRHASRSRHRSPGLERRRPAHGLRACASGWTRYAAPVTGADQSQVYGGRPGQSALRVAGCCSAHSGIAPFRLGCAGRCSSASPIHTTRRAAKTPTRRSSRSAATRWKASRTPRRNSQKSKAQEHDR